MLCCWPQPRRRVKGYPSRYLVGIGGISVIVSLGLIFLYLFPEVLPMLLSASMHRAASYATPGANPDSTVIVAMDRHREAAVRIGANGDLAFFLPADGKSLGTRLLPIPAGARVTSFAAAEP